SIATASSSRSSGASPLSRCNTSANWNVRKLCPSLRSGGGWEGMAGRREGRIPHSSALHRRGYEFFAYPPGLEQPLACLDKVVWCSGGDRVADDRATIIEVATRYLRGRDPLPPK